MAAQTPLLLVAFPTPAAGHCYASVLTGLRFASCCTRHTADTLFTQATQSSQPATQGPPQAGSNLLFYSFLVFMSTCLNRVPPLLKSLVLVYAYYFFTGFLTSSSFFICQTLSPTSCSILRRYRWPFLWATITRRALTTPPRIVGPYAPVFSPHLHCISVESSWLALKFPTKNPMWHGV